LPGITNAWGKVLEAANYTRWVRESEAQREVRAPRGADQPPFAPRFAAIISAGSQQFRGLEATLESLAAQTYPRWNAVVLFEGAPEHIDRLRRAFPTIEFRERPAGQGAGTDTEVREAALETGAEFVLVLRPGVVLHATALMSFAEACASRPETEVLYADEDRLDRRGMRYDPFLKPEWNPELLRSQNYFGRLVAIRAARLGPLPAFGALPDALLEWARSLWVTAAMPSTRIRHVPEILCHVTDGSVAARAGEGRPEEQAALLSRYAREHGIPATVVEVPGASPRLRYEVPDVAPLVSVIIPTRNGVDLLVRCIRSIRERTRYSAFEILIVDNGSDDPATVKYLDDLQRLGAARVLRYDAPFNYSAINNFAVAHAAGDLVCLLNNDTEVISPDWLGEMVGHAIQPGVGAVGAMLYYPDDTIQHAGVTLGLGGLAGHRFIAKPRGYAGPRERLRHAQNLSAVTAACLLVQKRIYLEVDGLDQESFPVAYNDVDFCLRLRMHGYRNVWTPFAELYHFEGASRGRDSQSLDTERYRRESAQFVRRWGDVLRRDPLDRPDLQSGRPAATNEPSPLPKDADSILPRISETAI
jgi:GT2 family glycosyltransferase